MKPTFEGLVEETITRATGTCNQRGAEYGDSWKNPSFSMFEAVWKKVTGSPLTLTLDQKKAVALAVLVDIKYNRMVGGYKEDSIDDGINYAAALASQVRKAVPNPTTPSQS